jgi:two-component system LytT family response regulator
MRSRLVEAGDDADSIVRLDAMRVFLVDDESLALERLARMLRATGRVEIAGQEVDPEAALERLGREPIDALFLDIQMPGLNGFELLTRLASQPPVVFTTAYDEYALRAFEVYSIDYLLKPIEQAQLERALNKLERLATAAKETSPPDVSRVLAQLASSLQHSSQHAQRGYPTRIATRSGERVRFIELSRITHFFAQDKLTYAATADGQHVIDRTVVELEQELDPARFVRIHRAMLLNTDFIDEIHSWFGGRLRVRLKDDKHTELTVARDRVRDLKDRLSF